MAQKKAKTKKKITHAKKSSANSPKKKSPVKKPGKKTVNKPKKVTNPKIEKKNQASGKRYRSPEEIRKILSQEETEEENDEQYLATTREEQHTALMGRCVGRTFNYDEAKGICRQFEAAGYQTSIIEKKRGGLSLYEVWATKTDETIY